MTIASHQYIAIYGIKDIVLAIGVVCAIVFSMKAKTKKLFVDFLLGGQTGISHKLLNQDCTDFTITILGKANHAVGAVGEIGIMCFNTFKEWCKIII